MSLIDFLFHHTRPRELCVICVDGYIMAAVYVDYEDRFVKYLSKDFDSMTVVKDEWKSLETTLDNGCSMYVPAHYIYLEENNNG